MEEEFPFLSLLLITGLATVVPLLASRLRRLRLPIVVGEILAGIVIGESGFDLIESSQTLEFLRIFGFTYLMFISGLEVDLETITANPTPTAQKTWRHNPIILSLLVFGVTLAGALAAAFGLLQAGLIQRPFMMALILSTTSLGIVVPVLKERGLMVTAYGQALLMAALVADFGTLLLITVQIAIISQGLTLEVLLVLLLLVAFAVAVRVGKLIAGLPGLARVIEDLSHATAQIRVRGAIALLVAFIVLAEWLGSEIILGAFLAGAVISLLPERGGSDLHQKMDAIGFGFFIPIFFIMVGVRFDLPALLASSQALLLVPLLLVVAYLIKFGAALFYRFNFPWRQTLGAGALLSARLSLIIAAAAIALELGIINEAVNSAVILVAIVTCTASPLIFNAILPPQYSVVRKGIILVGLGEMAIMLAGRLAQAGEPVVLVGQAGGRNRSIRQANLTICEGDPTSPDVLAAAQAASAAALVAMSGSDEVNLVTCRLAVEQFGIPHRVAQISDPQIASELVELGVRVIQPQLATVLALEGALHFPAAFDMLTNHLDGVEVREIELSSSPLTGRPLRQIRLPGDALVLGLRRGGEVLVPHGDTRLLEGDLLMLVGHQDSLQQAIRRLNPGVDFTE